MNIKVDMPPEPGQLQDAFEVVVHPGYIRLLVTRQNVDQVTFSLLVAVGVVAVQPEWAKDMREVVCKVGSRHEKSARLLVTADASSPDRLRPYRSSFTSAAGSGGCVPHVPNAPSSDRGFGEAVGARSIVGIEMLPPNTMAV